MVSNIAGQAVAMGDETKGMSLPVVTGFNSECFTRMKQAQRVFQKAIYIWGSVNIIPQIVQNWG